jgi:hypothetical protein
LVLFAALRHMVVSLISHPCLVAVLRLIRDRVAPVSASTCSLNVGFPTGFRFRNSGGVGLQKSLTLLTPCVITLNFQKAAIFPKSALICAHSSACCCCCCWCLCCRCCLSCCLWCCLNAWNSAKSDVAPDSGVADAEATCPFAFKRFPLWQKTARWPFFLQFVQLSAFAGQFCLCS